VTDPGRSGRFICPGTPHFPSPANKDSSQRKNGPISSVRPVSARPQRTVASVDGRPRCESTDPVGTRQPPTRRTPFYMPSHPGIASHPSSPDSPSPLFSSSPVALLPSFFSFHVKSHLLPHVPSRIVAPSLSVSFPYCCPRGCLLVRCHRSGSQICLRVSGRRGAGGWRPLGSDRQGRPRLRRM
jgi:hypothetical protein